MPYNFFFHTDAAANKLERFFLAILYSGLYYKHVTIVNYASSGINKLKASLNVMLESSLMIDVFRVQATA
jgi:hypothetical protein